MSLLADADSLERQVQISEWTYQDKLETLFIFQLMYIGLLVLILFMVLAKIGFFRTGFVYLIAVTIPEEFINANAVAFVPPEGAEDIETVGAEE